MRFNPISRRLFTDDLRFLKTLGCPSMPRWAASTAETGGSDRECATCGRVVVDSSRRTDDAIADLLASDPHTCIKVRLDQPNIIVLHHEPSVSKWVRANCE